MALVEHTPNPPQIRPTPTPPDDTAERLAALESQLATRADRDADRTVALLMGLLAVAGALILGVVLWSGRDRDGSASAAAASTTAAAPAGHDMAAMGGTAAAKDTMVEHYKRPDPTLPAVPAGAVKHFRMQVYEHVTKVSDDLPATKVWSYAVNGVAHRGTGVSTPMVVNLGDKVEIELVNQGSKAFSVDFPHSIDFHSAEVSPEKDYATIAPGSSKTFRFTAKHPGVFMYHCATNPVLMHTGAGMVGAMIVKPRHLAAVHHEYWITQQEYYLGAPGAPAELSKMQAEKPDVVAFNGYANQYKKAPIEIGVGETARLYVLNAGPSLWSAFHIIGTVFDRTVIEGQVGHDAQTVNLAPSQGGWVEFTLDAPGSYTFVDHSFAAMPKGAAGSFKAVGAGS
jgi:nitrite reductase (NO-forming)